MPKACPFCCRSSPDIKFSNEHILRDKLNDTFPPIERSVEWANRVSTTDGSSSLSRRLIPQGPFDRTVNSVCEQCNGGWMNALEEEVEGSLLDLLYGRTVSPRENRRLALARWAVKTAGVYSLLHRDGVPGFPDEHFPHLRDSYEPPPCTYVWLCENGFDHNSFMRYRRGHVASAPGMSFYLYTLSVGRAVFFVLGAKSQATISKILVEVGLRDTLAERLWPLTENKPIERLVVRNRDDMLMFSDLVFPSFQHLL
ncbi:hypothetical protein D3C76_764120 [compost metagenome]